MEFNPDYYIQQLPNFLGLLIAIIIQWQMLRAKQALIEQLINVIIKQENCDKPEKP